MSTLEGKTLTDEPSTASAAEISDEEIAAAAEEMLTRDFGGAVLLSTLGNRLSAKLGRPLRVLLGHRKLQSILKAQLGSRLTFEGEASRILVRSVEPSQLPLPTRFDRVFWAAFAKPLEPNMRRWISPKRPFDFADLAPDQSPLAGWEEISPGAIPELGMRSRDAKIVTSIQHWCAEHGRSPIDFSLTGEPHGRSNSPADAAETTLRSGGEMLEVLRHFIDAIPQSERANYNLPLDLVRRFLS